ncbi:hypothetical protein Glove_674g13 [Diversispora epigaea]|uniref:Uncharacterized protein n=1 Tax=Diversispora epigaea TaxID=1348612 RepID=A0A397GBH7_9GLOM|nr:hypothetical protein Glove_674g13 [Diversispora epigaea]
MVSLSELCGTNCTDAEWYEYCKMPQVRDNETPSKWMDRIWSRLQYFRKNDLLLIESKKYLEARKLILVPTLSTYAPEIELAICFSCDQLIYTGERTANIGNYNHIGMKRHWKFSCSGNKYCGQKSNSAYNFDDMYALHRYKLWMQNTIRKIERVREIGKKIQAAKVIQQKWLELFYRPEGMCATQLA